MARNGSGTYTAVVNSINPAVATTTIDASAFNDVLDDLETALTESIARDGQTTTTAVVPFASGIKADTIVENSANTGVTIDGVLIKDGGATFTAAVIGNKGADIASATALVLGADGNYFDVTGTTTITSITTVGGNPWIKLHFDGALILTHHATDLILPGAANITTAAGDEAEFVEYATGDWRCVNYSPVFATDAEAIARTATNKAVTPANLAAAQTCRIKTGTYTGDGTTSKAITGVGFQPIFLTIAGPGADGNSPITGFTWDTIMATDAQGLAIVVAITGDKTTLDNRILSLDADGFTVSDDSTDVFPNTNTLVYHYTALG